MVINTALTKLGAACNDSTFFGVSTWHKYVPKSTIPTRDGTQYCSLNFDQYGVGTFWLVVAGLIDILLRIGAIISVAYFIYGAFRLVTSQGSPDGVKAARGTMTNALIGLVVCIMSTWILGFIVERLLA